MRVNANGVAAIRALTLVFFAATAFYGILAFSPFAYNQFIRPNLIPWLGWSVTFYGGLFLGVLSVTLLTLLADVERPATRALALGYIAVWGVVALGLFIRPVLASLGANGWSLAVAAIALAPPLWLAAIDHLALWPVVFPRTPDEPRAAVESDPIFTRLFAAGALTALYVWLAYTGLAAVRQVQIGQAGFSSAGTARSLLLHLALFTAVSWLFVSAASIARHRRARRQTEYLLALLILAVWIYALMRRLVLPAIGAGGPATAAVAAVFALAMAAGWSGIALRLEAAGAAAPSGIDVFVRPAVPFRARGWRIAMLALLPCVAYVALTATEQMDWGFLQQKGGVLAVWFVAWALILTLVSGARRPPLASAIAWSLVVIASLEIARAFEGSETAPDRIRRLSRLERYASLDPSFRTLDDALADRPRTPDAYYEFLIANSNVVPSVSIAPRPIEFTPHVAKPPAAPHIFLFVLDSLRADYLSPYNPAVNFTPQIDQVARESFVFRRAFTRYAGTGLAVPSIWSGAMLPHRQYVMPFEPMNALLTLLRGSGYRVMASLDSLMIQLLDRPPGFVELGAVSWTARDDGCQVLADLTRVLDSPIDGPVFAYSLPQNLHLAYVQGHPILNEPHPGFYAPLAARVRQFDQCFGEFVSRLKQRGLYDDSVIIVTSDHGDSLGEGGRWGHGFAGFPEIFRVPLIVRIPPRLARDWSADVDAVSFTTDITPSLYRLLGNEVTLRGPVVGMPLFYPRTAAPLAARRRGMFLLASSYGPVYGLLQRNGELLYVVDSVNSRDYAFNLHGGVLHEARRPITAAERLANQQAIREQIEQIAAYYHFDAQPSR